MEDHARDQLRPSPGREVEPINPPSASVSALRAWLLFDSDIQQKSFSFIETNSGWLGSAGETVRG